MLQFSIPQINQKTWSVFVFYLSFLWTSCSSAWTKLCLTVQHIHPLASSTHSSTSAPLPPSLIIALSTPFSSPNSFKMTAILFPYCVFKIWFTSWKANGSVTTSYHHSKVKKHTILNYPIGQRLEKMENLEWIMSRKMTGCLKWWHRNGKGLESLQWTCPHQDNRWWEWPQQKKIADKRNHHSLESEQQEVALRLRRAPSSTALFVLCWVRVFSSLCYVSRTDILIFLFNNHILVFNRND